MFVKACGGRSEAETRLDSMIAHIKMMEETAMLSGSKKDDLRWVDADRQALALLSAL